MTLSSRLKRFAQDIAAAVVRLFSRQPVRAPRPHVFAVGHRPTLIIAYNYAQAREHAIRNKIKDWRVASHWEHLCGYRHVHIIKLDGWKNDKSGRFLDALDRLERQEVAA